MPNDLLAGATLAAIAVPAQMATAKLAGFPPQFGFFALIAGAIAFALFGHNKLLSCAADSTIAPIFAGSLVAFAPGGSSEYAAAAGVLALMVGGLVVLAGAFRLDRIADLLSLPVTLGFFAGIAVHIVVAQLPSLLGLTVPDGSLPQKIAYVAVHLGDTGTITAVIGFGVFALICLCEWISPRLPGALIALVAATTAAAFLDLPRQGVAVLGTIRGTFPAPHLPLVDIPDLLQLAPLSLIIALVVMVQTAATTRAYPSVPHQPPNIHRDFIGVGAGNLLAGLIGAFPVNASPPSTAILFETGGRSQLANLLVCGLVVLLLLYGGALLRFVPDAALAGVLLFVAMRLVKIQQIFVIFRQSVPEFLLIVVTIAAIVLLPIEEGTAVGIILSLVQGIWSTSHARIVPFEHVPGTSIWWPARSHARTGDRRDILVLGFEAPLSFLNCERFRRDIEAALAQAPEPARLVILEASGILDLDFTAAQSLRQLIEDCHARAIPFAIARLESLQAQDALARFEIIDALGQDRIFRSVDEAVRALAQTRPAASE